MGKGVPLLYGSTTGNTAGVAERIAERWTGSEPIELIDIGVDGVTPVIAYETLIIGAPTWDFGELQQDWADEWESFCQLDLSGMRVALFGVGDQLGYPEWFQDSLGLIANQVRKAGGVLVAPWPNQGYKFEASLALMEGEDQFVGLALDEDSQAWATDERLEVWLKQVQLEFS